MTLRNDRRIGVRNGNRGVVVAVDPDDHTMRVRLTRGDIDLPARYVDAGHVGHAYAMTVNKAHGLTCDRTMTLGDDQIYRELAYEALSRGRLSNHVYIPRSCIDLDQELPHARTVDSPDPMDLLEQGLRRSHAKQLALDQMATVPLQAWTTSDLLTERDRIRTILDQAPPDRSRDLDALTKTRRAAVSELKQANFDVARLECRKRPLRERRKPDVELIHANNQAVTGAGPAGQARQRDHPSPGQPAPPTQPPRRPPSRRPPTRRHRPRPRRTHPHHRRPRRRRPAHLHHPSPRPSSD